ncbi:MAG: DNA mismatch repair protein MutS [archaeon]|nr:DNA mismatch repair protein MutS [archaeon]MDA0842952.1 DNA mismatch repair protein MutS [archaeon]
MDQFAEIKNEHKDTILFFRMGDFYELFFEDAQIASDVLGLALTSRDKNAETPIPMAGFPWHALQEHLKKMLQAGYKVTIAEQEEDLRDGAKILERVVTRVYTPGTLYEEGLLQQNDRSVLLSISVEDSNLGLAMFDASTGRLWGSTYAASDFGQLIDDCMTWEPSELVVSAKDASHPLVLKIAQQLDHCVLSTHFVAPNIRKKRLQDVLQQTNVSQIDIDSQQAIGSAVGLGADYLAYLHVTDELSFSEFTIRSDSNFLILDQTTLRNLELSSTLSGESEGSLLSKLNKCRTAMGRRLLREWILQPLIDTDSIISRQNAVHSLQKSGRRLDGLRETLKGVRDIERLATQLAYGRANARDLVATSDALERMPSIISWCQESNDPLLLHLSQSLDSLQEVGLQITAVLEDEAPLGLRDGGLIRTGVDEEIDELRRKSEQGVSWFDDLEKQLRATLDIPSLKVRMNRQIGWYIEVTKTHEAKVPQTWRRKQQMTSGSRYSTEELSSRDDILMNAETRLKELEYRKFLELRTYCRAFASELSQIGRKIASIDVLQCFATVARMNQWCRPEIDSSKQISISKARHPVLDSSTFVPNDISMTSKQPFLLMTGPNMGGKSTYLRTVALLCILSQAGSFIPAQKAKIGLVDRIFTRVGASDDLMKGRSTFMVEMVEVAHILRNATSDSLILLDEVGRGTSTFDGLSLAWAVCEDISNRLGSRTLFATHYHQLTGLEGEISNLKNIHVQVSQASGKLEFLHTVADGPCDDSYGIQVAALAGVPQHVVERSLDVLKFLEQQASGARAGEKYAPASRDHLQKSLFGIYTQTKEAIEVPSPNQEIIDRLQSLNVEKLSPLEALQILYDISNQLGGGSSE